MTLPVLCALRGHRESAVVTALEGAGGRIAVTRRCADLAELLGAADAGLGRVALVSDDLPLLDRETVGRLRAAGVRVAALTADGARGAERMVALGADVVVDAAAPLDELVATVIGLAESTGGGRGRGTDPIGPDDDGPTRDRAVPGPAAERRTVPADPVPTDPAHPDPATSDVDAPPGRVVAVWGPTGAPGRTTVAVNLAAELAALPVPGRPPRAAPGPAAGSPRATAPGPAPGPAAGPARGTAPGGGALVVDADTYGGTVAQVLGLLDEAPGIAAAARAAGQGGLDVAALARLTPEVGDGLRVLTGISRADRWPELPGSSLDVVWQTARGLTPWVVVDCGFCLEQDEVLSYDTHAPRRNAATLSALTAADVVVVVGSGDAVGMQRLVRAIAELADTGAAATAEHVVVVNRVRASAAGRRPEHAVREALARYAGVEHPHLVPDDRAALDAALLQGATLREAAPRSPAHASLAALAVRLAGVDRPADRPRRRLRASARA